MLGSLDHDPLIAYYPANSEIIEWPGWKYIEIRALRGGSGHIWEQTALWRASRNGALISLCNSGPVLHKNQIVALHDANIYAIPHAFSWKYRLFHKALRPILARRADQLVTVSAFSAQELARYCSLSSKEFRIIPNSADHILRIKPESGALTEFGLSRGRYLLAVGNQSPNKNIARLAAAYAEVKDLPILAIAGGEAHGLAAAGIENTDRIRVLGRVDDRSLRALYEGAKGFVWPSFYEGFGIPPLEAMALGTPVLASRNSAMPEILGNAAVYFDPESLSDIRLAIELFCKADETEHNLMRSRGSDRAHLYSWENSAATLRDMVELSTTGRQTLVAE
ncbi:MAG: glycosyltransferase family 1 protein [Paracoccaceae bacterium]